MSGKYAFGVGMQHSFWGTGQTGGLPLNVSTLGDTLVDAGYDTHFVYVQSIHRISQSFFCTGTQRL